MIQKWRSGQNGSSTERRSWPRSIALAFRRFHDARFNVYEKVLRLRDLAEAITYFVYNVLLIDFLRNLDQRKYEARDAGMRRAYNGYSIAARLGFISSILAVAKNNQGADLFVREIANAEFIESAKRGGQRSKLRGKAA